MLVLTRTFNLFERSLFHSFIIKQSMSTEIQPIMNNPLSNGKELITLSNSAQQAVWASLVIKSIINAKYPQSID
jgi:hypothetical protein